MNERVSMKLEDGTTIGYVEKVIDGKKIKVPFVEGNPPIYGKDFPKEPDEHINLHAENERLKDIIVRAENCLVCVAIADVKEVVRNTMDILKER